MTDLEILAELKRSYEYFVDILDNENEQLGDDKNREIIYEMENNLEEIYEDVYKRMGTEIYYDKYLKIGDDIFSDYLDVSEDVIFSCSYKDLDSWNKWWEDEDFITYGQRFREFNKEV